MRTEQRPHCCVYSLLTPHFSFLPSAAANLFATARTYTGQQADGTGLMYYHARYYDPAAGQFISPDAIVPDPTNVMDYQRYAYARGNPMRFGDPSGHFSEDQLKGWYGENWRSLFTAEWRKLLLDGTFQEVGAQFGDVIMASWGDKSPTQYVVVSGRDGKPALWDTDAKVPLELAVHGYQATTSLGLYRLSQATNGSAGNTLLGLAWDNLSGKTIGTISAEQSYALTLVSNYSTGNLHLTGSLAGDWAVGNKSHGMFVAGGSEYAGIDPWGGIGGYAQSTASAVAVTAFDAFISGGSLMAATTAALTGPAVLLEVPVAVHQAVKMRDGYSIQPCPTIGPALYCK